MFAPSSSLWFCPAHFAYVSMSIVKTMPCESSQFKIYMLTGMEKVRGSTETWFSSEFLFERTWRPLLYLLSLGMDAFSSSMPCSPECSAEWVGYVLLMCFWGKPWGKETECKPVGKGILGRLQKIFPVPGEIRGTRKQYKETILF